MKIVNNNNYVALLLYDHFIPTHFKFRNMISYNFSSVVEKKKYREVLLINFQKKQL